MSGGRSPRVAELFAAAMRQHQAGRLREADALYRQVLAIDPNHPDSLHGVGLIAYQSGRGDEAATLIGKAVAIDGRAPEFLSNLGAVLQSLGRLEEAADAYRRAIALRPDYAAAHNNLGNTLSELGRMDAAEASYRRALSLQPTYVEAHYNLGLALQAQDRLDEAAAAYGQAIALRPDHAAAHNNLGNVRLKQDRQTDAADAYARAVAVLPGYAEAHFNLGAVHQGQGEPEAAEAAYRRAVALKPDHADAWNNLGLVLRAQGKLEAAAQALTRATALKPDYWAAWNNLGSVRHDQGRLADAEAILRRVLEADADDVAAHHGLGLVLHGQGRLEEAAASHRRAIALRPDFPEAYDGLGNALQHNSRLTEAIESYGQAIALRPDYVDAHNNLGNALQDRGEPEAALESYDRALALRPDAAQAGSNRLFALAYGSALSPEALLDEHRRWGERHAAKAPTPRHANDRNPDRRLRVGYVSADFRAHSVAYFAEPLFKGRDREKIELFAYAETPRPDRVTERLKGLSDHWRFTVGMTDEALAERVRADRIDILVDLGGHTAGNRLTLFACKPAPVQATWLGYPNTTGLDAIDYRIVDAFTDPPGRADTVVTEILVRLPDGFLCYAPLPDAPEVSPSPSLSGRPLTFGSFNNPCKLSDETIETWAALLARLPEARLLLKGHVFADAVAHDRYQARFTERGIAAERLSLQGWTRDIGSHLATYAEVDIALDPFPYNGTTTTCEALWMGVPVVTLAGDRHSGRVGASLLTQVGLSELIADSRDRYVEIAAGLAQDPAQLAALRAGLRPRMAASSLCDAPGFARRFEAALRAMWRRRCAGLPAGPLDPQ